MATQCICDECKKVIYLADDEDRAHIGLGIYGERTNDGCGGPSYRSRDFCDADCLRAFVASGKEV